MLIKTTKLSEEQQSVALVGKRTIEDVKSVIGEKGIVLSGGTVVIKNLNFLNNQDSLTMLGDEKSFNTTLYLDSNYNFCAESDPKCVYEEQLKIEKAKSTKIKDNNAEADIDIDVNEDKLEEDQKNINEKIESIEVDFAMAKDEGEDEASTIKCGDDEEEEIPRKEGKLIIRVKISKVGNDARITIEDSSGNTLGDAITKDLNSDKVNHLNLHFNFKGYSKKDDEILKDLDVEVYNSFNISDNVVANIYIEKSVDLKVNVNPYKGKFYKYERDDNKEIVKIGPLYNMQVKIARKGELEDKKKILFSASANKNINIKAEDNT